MARIYQRGKIWYLDLTYKGRRVRKKVGTSKRMAELALKDAEIKIIKDEYGFFKSDITIESLIEKFLEYNMCFILSKATSHTICLGTS